MLFYKLALRSFPLNLSQDCCSNIGESLIKSVRKVVPVFMTVLHNKIDRRRPNTDDEQRKEPNTITDYEHFSNLGRVYGGRQFGNNYMQTNLTDLGKIFGKLTVKVPLEKMSNMEAMAQLENNAQTADNLIQEIYSKLAILQSCNPEVGAEVQNLLQQNEALKKKVDKMKEMLILQQIRNGGNPVVRDPKMVERSVDVSVVKQEAPPTKEASPVVKSESSASEAPQKSKKAKKEKEASATSVEGGQKGGKPKSGGAPAPAAENTEEVDIGRLDLRVGLIKECTRHPAADSLYVEKIDCGEENVRTVISGLVKHVPLDAMQNRMVVVLCNLKPSKMRGITSEAMVMCASTPEKVEILFPPQGSVPGDVVEVEGISRRPDAVLNPKKKIFETVAPDLKTNDSKQATYKGVPWTVPGKGFVTSESLCNVNIK